MGLRDELAAQLDELASVLDRRGMAAARAAHHIRLAIKGDNPDGHLNECIRHLHEDMAGSDRMTDLLYSSASLMRRITEGGE